MTGILMLVVVAGVLLSFMGATGFASTFKELTQKAAELNLEEKKLREELKGLFASARKSTDKKLTEDQTKRRAEIEGRLEEIAAERMENDSELANEKRRQELETATPGIQVGDDLSLSKPWGSDPVTSFGNFMGAVIQAGSPGGKIDKRLLQASASGGSTGASGDAGFLVQKDHSDILLKQMQAESVVLPLCDSIEISEDSDSLEAPYVRETSRADGSRFGGVQVYRRKEAATVTATKPDYGLFEVRLEDLMGLTYMTGRQVKDARASGQIVMSAYAAETAFRIDREIIRGNGVGEMTGALNAGCLVTQDKEATQAADTLVQANFSKMWSRWHPRSRRSPKARIFYNAECDPQLDGMYTPAGIGGIESRFWSVDAQGVTRYKGVPLVAIEQCSAIGDVGDVIFFDCNQYLVIKKGGTEQESSIHVRFLYDEMAVRFITRINGKPKWESALTPYKGSATLSPIVTLQAR